MYLKQASIFLRTLIKPLRHIKKKNNTGNYLGISSNFMPRPCASPSWIRSLGNKQGQEQRLHLPTSNLYKKKNLFFINNVFIEKQWVRSSCRACSRSARQCGLILSHTGALAVSPALKLICKALFPGSPRMGVGLPWLCSSTLAPTTTVPTQAGVGISCGWGRIHSCSASSNHRRGGPQVAGRPQEGQNAFRSLPWQRPIRFYIKAIS